MLPVSDEGAESFYSGPRREREELEGNDRAACATANESGIQLSVELSVILAGGCHAEQKPPSC